MDKRYLIFISSTYEDLKEEREKVIAAVLESNNIPTGMEMFPAVGIPPLDLIKQIIKECDYYILILGGRYGSYVGNSKISYTEEEYNYAVEQGIPVIPFFHSNPDSITRDKTDKNDKKWNLLKKFKDRVSAGGTTIKYWDNPDDLRAKVLLSIPQVIKHQQRAGWIKATEAVSSGVSLEEVKQLKKELDDLRLFKSLHEKDAQALSEAQQEIKVLQDRLNADVPSRTMMTDSILSSMYPDIDFLDVTAWVHAEVKFRHAGWLYDYKYKVEYTHKEWFRLIGITIKDAINSTGVTLSYLTKTIGVAMLKDINLKNQLEARAYKLIKGKKLTLSSYILHSTKVEIRKILLEETRLNMIIQSLSHRGLLTYYIDHDVIKLSDEGEVFLLDQCL